MRTTRTTAVVLAGAALGLPAGAEARTTDGPPARVLLRATVGDGVSVFAQQRAHRAERLRARVVHLARALDRAEGRTVRVKGERRRAERAAIPRLRHRAHVLDRRLAAARRPAPAAAPATAPSATLQAIAACESGGNPAAIGGGGAYRGKYQFDQHTWESVGGTGDPAAASEAEQDYRASILYSRAGSAPWPVCGS
jgi:soluble lytic murein transglycosylase-like protein